MESHNIYMQRCLELAKRGSGKTRTNPLVGACIVHDKTITGEGWHAGFGLDHAEVMAVKNVKNKLQLNESTLYVTLEPCNHFGKTPPCTRLILEHKIPRVVIGTTDPNPIVSGSGIQKLIQEGVSVITGVMEKDCQELIKTFRISNSQKRPYIILKWAQSKNGMTGIKNKSIWLTHPTSNIIVHNWRSEVDAIMVSSKTLRIDNPLLTTRLINGKSPDVVIIDRQGNLSKDLKVFSTDSTKYIFTTKPDRYLNIPYCKVNKIEDDFTNDIFKDILDNLYEHAIGTLLIEGGSTFHQLWLDLGLWDEIRILQTEKNIDVEGIPAPILHDFTTKTIQELPEDRLIIIEK